MMLNVSHTPVSDAWLSTLTTNKQSVEYNALNKEAFVTLEKNRFSVSTVDSELFPELLSWSALMNAMPPSYAQSIPSDITRQDAVHETNTTHETDSIHTIHETNTIHEANAIPASTIPETNTFHQTTDIIYDADIFPLLSSILDPTTLEVAGFDQSCLDALDDFLINEPFEAFLESCWVDATQPSKSAPSLRVTTTPLIKKPTGRKLPAIPSKKQIPEEYDGDILGEFLPFYREEEPTPVSAIGIELSPSASNHYSPWSQRDTMFSMMSDEDDATSFILFEAPVLNPKCYDSVGHFPMPSTRAQRTMPSRIATFCSNLPAPFSPVR